MSEHVNELLDHTNPDTRMPQGEHLSPQEKHDSDHRLWEGGADSTGVASNEVDLEIFETISIHAHLCERTKASVHTVDGHIALALNVMNHQVMCRLHSTPRILSQRDRGAVLPNGQHIVQGQLCSQ
jgi:hypothetical protein